MDLLPSGDITWPMSSTGFAFFLGVAVFFLGVVAGTGSGAASFFSFFEEAGSFFSFFSVVGVVDLFFSVVGVVDLFLSVVGVADLAFSTASRKMKPQ